MTDELAALDAKINALLPPRYQHCYGSVSASSMGSASLKYDADGRVEWDRIWTTFCDLALAGGPPHRGTLLDPVLPEDSPRYREVEAELCRAIRLTTLLPVESDSPGWVGVACESEAAAAWLQVAVVAENVTARRRGSVLLLPVAASFRIEKEVKNVVVALAKSYHYWDGHLTAGQKELTAGELLAEPGDAGWHRVECPDEAAAVWLLRAVAVERVLVRREGNALCVPAGVHAREVVANAWRLWQATIPH
ncbi:hypothetical protein [Limnoglobus roseus]|uniref:Uncharacterized protein n=1 Tax=Limnoglobus roseus TaxID=2598579 RepID=A0A5C1AL52_9BACT|nr:hypothetical protein [Limnoglobus roseus]QEL17914.1 hypothetical protein PX52LOC_04926 [Limnoglobus roseus]